jgi:hypothetical protein
VSVRRLNDGSWEIRGDTDCEIVIGGKTRNVTADEFATNHGIVKMETTK